MRLDQAARDKVNTDAEALYQKMNGNERFGLLFGLFPDNHMKASGYDGAPQHHDFVVALMAVAERNKGK